MNVVEQYVHEQFRGRFDDTDEGTRLSSSMSPDSGDLAFMLSRGIGRSMKYRCFTVTGMELAGMRSHLAFDRLVKRLVEDIKLELYLWDRPARGVVAGKWRLFNRRAA